MKKFVSVMAVLLLCLCAVLPAAAAQYSPSVTFQDEVDVTGAVMDGQDLEGCIVVTTVKQAQDESTDITPEERELLLRVYKELSQGTMTLPLEGYVIRELVDVSFAYEGCRQREDHNNKPEALEEDDVLVSIKFDLGIEPEAELAVMVFINEEWIPVENVVNNGDGTVTVDFEDICPVAFAVKQSASQTNSVASGVGNAQNTGNTDADEPQTQSFPWWIIILVAAVAVVAVVVISKKKK